MNYDVIVVGAGIAGIAAALRLNKQGKSVLVLEKNSYVGGKMNQHKINGYTWDSGPSLFTMPQLVDDLYALYGRNYKDYYNYERQEESCRYFFMDGLDLIFYTEINQLKEELQSKLGISGDKIENYLQASRRQYESIGKLFLETPIHKISKLPISKIMRMLPQIMKTNLFNSLHSVNEKALANEKLVQIFDRYATYNGSNPYKASGILSMIPHLEQNIGTFFPKEGMRSIVNGLYDLAKEEGIDIKFNENIDSCCLKNEAYKLKTNKGIYWAPRLVSAIDCVQFYDKILCDEDLTKRYKKQERSSSALIFYWGVKKSFSQLGLHNIFFSEDYKDEFKVIFKDKKIPFEGTIYVHISSKINKKDAPDNSENWFVMLNLPAGINIDDKLIAMVKSKLINRLEKALGQSIKEHIEVEKVWTPEGIALDTGAYKGALYGSSSNEKISAIKRHPNFSKKYKGLYFCGGTVHPGGGIPLSIQSAKIVDKLIADEG